MRQPTEGTAQGDGTSAGAGAADGEPVSARAVARGERSTDAAPVPTGADRDRAGGGVDRSGVPAAPRTPRRWLFGAAVLLVLALLFLLPWWMLFASGVHWPFPVFLAGTVVFGAWLVSFPFLMAAGHLRQVDRAARVADTSLGVVWVLFTWSVAGGLARLVMAVLEVGGTGGARVVAGCVAAVSVGLLAWGYHEAMRVPRVKRLDVHLPRLGGGLDGTRVVVLADTHYGPIDRTRWSTRVAEAVNALDPDVVVHAGDIADGTPTRRRAQSAPLGTIRARLAKVCVTGNHEYFGEAQSWLDRMAALGWEPLHNRHVVVESGGDALVLAGVDDVTAGASGLAGHGADLPGALAGADPDRPVLLVAHQPKYVRQAAAAGVDLQVSGHTHGGQMWPFHFLVRLDQPTVRGLSRHGARTQLYTSRGTGFWGPPFRVFAPAEITLLTLRSGGAPDTAQHTGHTAVGGSHAPERSDADAD